MARRSVVDSDGAFKGSTPAARAHQEQYTSRRPCWIPAMMDSIRSQADFDNHCILIRYCDFSIIQHFNALYHLLALED